VNTSRLRLAAAGRTEVQLRSLISHVLPMQVLRDIANIRQSIMIRSLISLGDDKANTTVYSSDNDRSCTVDGRKKASPPPALTSKIAGKRMQVQIQAPVPVPGTAPVPVPIEAPVTPVQIEAGNNVAVKRKKRKYYLNNGDVRCEHNTRRTICKHCKGKSLCEHLKQKQWCAICRPGTSGARCAHGKQKSRCVECGGTGICEHVKLRVNCSVCKAVRMQTK
jgi:hypothetical protein